MLVVVLIFFREPRRENAEPIPSLGQVVRNFGMVLRNFRFVLFLLIFSGYWIVFWQQYVILPIYIHDYIDPNANTGYILMVDPIIVITLTVAVNALTRRVPSFRAITLGTLITSLAWIFLATRSTVPMAMLALGFVALGEIIQSPRYYEYISRLAPPGQQGTYMGFAFLPIGIGSLIAGKLSGVVTHHYAEVQHRPMMVWWFFAALGIATALLLWIYDRVVKPGKDRLPAKA